MRTPEGKEAMMKLLATADVFLTNYRVHGAGTDGSDL